MGVDSEQRNLQSEALSHVALIGFATVFMLLVPLLFVEMNLVLEAGGFVIFKYLGFGSEPGAAAIEWGAFVLVLFCSSYLVSLKTVTVLTANGVQFKKRLRGRQDIEDWLGSLK
jgi:hypothetical protein